MHYYYRHKADSVSMTSWKGVCVRLNLLHQSCSHQSCRQARAPCLRDVGMRGVTPNRPKSTGCSTQKRDITQQLHRQCTWPTVNAAAYLCAHTVLQRGRGQLQAPMSATEQGEHVSERRELPKAQLRFDCVTLSNCEMALNLIHSYTIVITVKCKCHSAGSEHRVQSGCPFVPRHWLEPQGWIQLKAFTHRMQGVNNSDEYKKPTLLTEYFHTENECQAVEDKKCLLFFQTFALQSNTSTNHEACAEWMSVTSAAKADKHILCLSAPRAVWQMWCK